MLILTPSLYVYHYFDLSFDFYPLIMIMIWVYNFKKKETRPENREGRRGWISKLGTISLFRTSEGKPHGTKYSEN